MPREVPHAVAAQATVDPVPLGSRVRDDWTSGSRGSWLRRSLIVAVLAVATAVSGHAQVVRGAVREVSSGSTLPGVLVTLEQLGADDSSATSVASVLSNDRGEYTIRAPRPGRYRLAAKRIGVKRTLTAPFDLGTGAARDITIEIEPLLYTLPEVAVATANFCIPREEQVGRVAALWDEIRTALTATSITVRDTLYHGRIVSFSRVLDGRGRVLRESTQHREGQLSETFKSAPPESLSVHGYWAEEGDSVRFEAPDMDVLLSDAFLKDHCFELAEDVSVEAGLRFNPAPGRSVGDMRGTIWVDGRSFELRRIDFTYTRLPDVERANGLGGEVHFARLSSGAWVVRRWSLRVPMFSSQSVRGPSVQFRQGRPNPTGNRIQVNRVVPNRMLENGGVAYVDHLRTFEQPSRISGVVHDSTGKPFASGRVQLAGTRYVAETDANGRFRLDSLPPGVYRIEAVRDFHVALGTSAVDQDVSVEPGGEATVELKETGLNGVLTRMCGGRELTRDRTAIRIVLLDGERPYTGQPLRLWWTEYVRDRGVQRVAQPRLDATTASDGSVVFCGLPLNVSIELGVAIGPDRARRLETLSLTSRVPSVRTIRLP